MSRPLTWYRLHLTAPVDPVRVQAALTALAGLAGNPRVVSETVAANHQVSWRIGAEPWAIHRVIAALRTHLPNLRTEKQPDGATLDWPTAAATVHLPGSDRLPLGMTPRNR